MSCKSEGRVRRCILILPECSRDLDALTEKYGSLGKSVEALAVVGVPKLMRGLAKKGRKA
jgi:hypothetical protein